MDGTISGALGDFFARLDNIAYWQQRFGWKLVLAGYLIFMFGGLWLVIRMFKTLQRRRRQ